MARSSLAEKVAVEPFQMDAGAKQRKVKRRVRAKEVVMPLTLLLNANLVTQILNCDMTSFI